MPKKHEYLVGLDLGGHHTRCFVALEEQPRLRFISYGSAPSAGWNRGVIADQDPVLISVKKAIQRAEENGGMMIESAVVGIGGPHITSNVSHTYLNLPAKENEIAQHHVDEIVKEAGEVAVGDDRTVIQLIPLEFAVNRQAGLRNPLGMPGQRLDAHVQVISSLAQAHDNIRAVVNRAGLVVQETVFESFASAHAVLEEQEREVGVAVVDMGAGSLEVVAYLENQLRVASSIPIGGEHFANDVADILSTSSTEARRVIEQYGCVLADQTPENVMIEIPAVSQDSSRSSPRKLLNEVLQARAEEAFGLVRQELRRAGVEGRLSAGVVLTGGLACIAGSCDIAEKVLGVTTRIGLPPRLEYMPDELDDPSWATAAGLALYAQRLWVHRQRRRDKMTEWLRNILE